MKRHYFISNDLEDIAAVERELEASGISTPQIHVLSNDDAGVEMRRLNEVEDVLKKDVVRGTWRGAIIGGALAMAIVLLYGLTGLAAAYTWVPAIFLAVVVFGFCAWEGGLIGIGEPHVDFRQYQDELKQGHHVLLVDVNATEEATLQGVVNNHPALRAAGEGEATPGWVIDAQRKWSRFMEVAP
tara:strand:+ start:201721 stop:202275 length:555 start_codon:yes stop_codon:yes gene_type:complete